MENTTCIKVSCTVMLSSMSPNKAIEELKDLISDHHSKHPLDIFDCIKAKHVSYSVKEIKRNRKVKQMIRENKL